MLQLNALAVWKFFSFRCHFRMQSVLFVKKLGICPSSVQIIQGDCIPMADAANGAVPWNITRETVRN